MRRIMTWIFYAIGGVGMAIFAVGMGDDMPNPISFTASPEWSAHPHSPPVRALPFPRLRHAIVPRVRMASC